MALGRGHRRCRGRRGRARGGRALRGACSGEPEALGRVPIGPEGQARQGEIDPVERERLGRIELLQERLELDRECRRVETGQRLGYRGLGQHRGERPELAGRREHGADAGHQSRHRRVADERHAPGHRLVQGERERVHVRAVVDRPALDLFGRGVAGSSHHRTERFGYRRLGERPGKTEIGHEEAPVVVKKEVGRFDVAVDESSPVRICEPVGRLGADRGCLLRAQQSPRVQQGPQAPAAEVLEHEVGNAVLVTPVVDVKHVAVVQRCGQSRLGLELAEEGCIAGQGRVKQLDRDASTEARVVGGKDLGRSTGTDHGQQSVAAANYPADLFHGARHGDQEKGNGW